MIELKLNQISHIRTGYTQRNLKVSKKEGDVFLIKPSNFKEEYFYVENPDKANTSEFRKIDTHQLKNNEILIVNKGSSISSYLYKNDGNRYIATSSFFILRIISDKVFPEYLHWYLSQETTKEQIESFSYGSVVKTFSKKNLSTILIPIPSKEKQQEIIDFFQAIIDEKKNQNLYKKNTESIYQVKSKKYLKELR
jgi:restriction endonuclease S subunit